MFVLGQIVQIEKLYLIVVLSFNIIQAFKKFIFSELKEPDGECLGFTD